MTSCIHENFSSKSVGLLANGPERFDKSTAILPCIDSASSTCHHSFEGNGQFERETVEKRPRAGALYRSQSHSPRNSQRVDRSGGSPVEGAGKFFKRKRSSCTEFSTQAYLMSIRGNKVKTSPVSYTHLTLPTICSV